MKYTTQMDAARKGIVTPQMETVARKENMRVEDLMERMARGAVIIPANRNHVNLDPEGVGEGMRIKINVNLGISKDCSAIEPGAGQGPRRARSQGRGHLGLELLRQDTGVFASGWSRCPRP